MVTPASLKFCDFNSQEFEQLYKILAEVFDTTQEELERLYKGIDENFDKPGWPHQFTSRDFFKTADEAFQSTYQESPVIAVDLPSLMEFGDERDKKPTIAIIGQDSRQNFNHEKIVVGTPYGLHHKGSREELPTTKLYFDMIQVLLGLGYRVYLTDIHKIWVCNPQRQPYYLGKTLPKADQQRFQKVIKEELEVVQPVTVITWGRVAGRAIDQLNLGYNHQNFLHPSGANNGAWRKLIGKPATNENKLAYWKEEMERWHKERTKAA